MARRGSSSLIEPKDTVIAISTKKNVEAKKTYIIHKRTKNISKFKVLSIENTGTTRINPGLFYSSTIDLVPQVNLKELRNLVTF